MKQVYCDTCKRFARPHIDGHCPACRKRVSPGVGISQSGESATTKHAGEAGSRAKYARFFQQHFRPAVKSWQIPLIVIACIAVVSRLDIPESQTSPQLWVPLICYIILFLGGVTGIVLAGHVLFRTDFDVAALLHGIFGILLSTSVLVVCYDPLLLAVRLLWTATSGCPQDAGLGLAIVENCQRSRI